MNAAVVFDLDKVLLDFAYNIAVPRIAGKIASSFDENSFSLTADCAVSNQLHERCRQIPHG